MQMQTSRVVGLDPALEVLQKGIEQGSEHKISSHLLLEAMDRQRAGLEILHKDLFDSSAPVVLSALAVLGRIRDPRSVKLIVRLLTGQDENIQAAAVQALQAIGLPACTRIISDLFKISKSDRVRCAILEALATLAPKDAAVLAIIRDCSSSQLVSAEIRARAAGLYVRLEGEPAAELLLESHKSEIVEAVYGAARQSREITEVAVRHGSSRYHRLSMTNRRLLVTLAGESSAPGSDSIILKGLTDIDPEVRRAAYQVVGAYPSQLDYYPQLIGALGERVDPVLTLEEEALAAIERMDSQLNKTKVGAPAVSQRIQARIQDLFKAVGARERQVTSDSHELGWLISRSREYLEYYADEEFRQALLNSLKGGAYFTADRLQVMLKATAVKVEVRHFDGYRALTELIQNPKRPGIALVAREVAIARLGKRETMYCLIRNLRLARMVALPPEADPLFRQIYSWAKEAKLYRLAEAALQAMMRVDPVRATEYCEECLRLPVFSKLCAIAAIRLLKELDWSRMEPTLLRLVPGVEDSNILLNLIDALSSLKLKLGGELLQALVGLFSSGKDQQVLSWLAELLGSQDDSAILDSIISGFERAEPWRQDLILKVIERGVGEGRAINREGLSEFLYKILRFGDERAKARAAVLLWKLGDNYALQVLQDLLRVDDGELRTEMVRALRGALGARLIPALQPLLRLENASLQEALRATLLSATEEEARAKILKAVLTLRGTGGGAGEAPEGQEEVEAEVKVEFDQERKAFRFERENVQELAILFTDIQGYSRKAQMLSSMQLASLLQDYEAILLPGAAAHRGELIKKMGDGHLFVFQRPLDATLAAIRLQKALKRFNSYREEALRLIVRIGLHWGKVVCKEGDVLGNNVNIANRLQGSAKAGSILISDAVYQRLGGQIHAREIGLIEVKNISEPIKVYEPYEIVIGLPVELDPLKSLETSSAGRNGGPRKQALMLDRGAIAYLAETFAALAQLCQKAERRQAPVEAIRRELTSRWQKLRGVLVRSKR